MKPLADAKQRLAGVLSADERRVLSLAMLTDVVRAAARFDAVWVLNSDSDAAEVAIANGAEARPDPAPLAGQNASLDAATADAVATGARGVLIVSADVPGATPDALDIVASAAGVAVAPDAAGTGTNVLWRDPGDVIRVAFGANSRHDHQRRAQAAGCAFRLEEIPSLALDIDAPDDLALAAAEGTGPATEAALRALGYPSRRWR